MYILVTVQGYDRPKLASFDSVSEALDEYAEAKATLDIDGGYGWVQIYTHEGERLVLLNEA